MRWRSNYHLAKLSQSVLHNLNGEMRPTQGPDRGKATILLSTSFRVINVESGYSCASFAKSSHIKLACPKVAHLGHCFLPAAMPLPTSEDGTGIFPSNTCDCSDQRVQQPNRAIQQLKRGRPSSNCNPTPVAAPTEQTWASSTSCRTPAVVGSHHPVTRFSRHVLVRKMQHDLQEMFRNSCSNNTRNGNQCIV